MHETRRQLRDVLVRMRTNFRFYVSGWRVEVVAAEYVL